MATQTKAYVPVKRAVELKDVLVRSTRTKETLNVEVVAFDEFNDAHQEFAYNFSDLLYAQKSANFESDRNTVARKYVELFLCHAAEDADNDKSVYSKVRGDLRACRTLLHQPEVEKEFLDFFGLA